MVKNRFRSKYDHTIDDKGRFSLPSRFREVLQHQYDSEILVVIPWWGTHLRAYPVSEWELLEDKLRAEGGFKPENLDKIIRYLESESIECALDKQGRILLPPGLRSELGLKKDIVLIGMIDRVEIWDKEAWNKEREVGREHFGENEESIRKMGII